MKSTNRRQYEEQHKPTSQFTLTQQVNPKYQTYSQISVGSEYVDSDRDIPKQGEVKIGSPQIEMKEVLTQQITKLLHSKSLNEEFVGIKHENRKSQSNVLLTYILRDRLVDKFRKNLLTNAYIASKSLGKLKNLEQYMRKEKSEQIANSYSSQVPLFSPSSRATLIWDLANIIIQLFILWISPFITSFQNYVINEIPQWLYISVLVILILDIGINFNREIILQGQVLQSRKLIAKYYCQNFILIDILNFISILIVFEMSNTTQIFKICSTIIQYYLSYSKIQRNFQNHFESIYMKSSLSNLLDLISLILFLYYFAHFAGCFWHCIADNTSYLGSSWLIHSELIDASALVRYNYSFYWATTTMTTVGYGDFTPKNTYEIIYTDVIMFLSSCVFGYSMNSIGIILKNINDTSLKYKLTITQINQYMSKHQIDQSLQSRIRNYLKYYIEKQSNENLEDVNNLVTNLPKSLEHELIHEIQMKVIKKMKILMNHFTPFTQNQCADSLEQINFTPGDYIFKAGDKHDQYIYFLEEGQIELIDQSSQITLRTVHSSEIFGYYQFFSGFPPLMTARSTGFSELYRISRLKFMELLQYNRLDQETFHHIKDQIIFNNNYFLLDYKCTFCGRCNHQEIDCPSLQYKPDLEQRIKSSQFQNVTNSRVYYFRKARAKSNTRLMMSLVTFQAQNYTEQDLNTGTVSLQQFISDKLSEEEMRQVHQSDEQNIPSISQKKLSNLTVKISGEDIKKHTVVPVETKTKIRPTVKKITMFKESIQLKEILMVDEFLPKYQFHECCIDSLQSYKKYMPTDNIDQIIKAFQRKKVSKYLMLKHKLGMYTFYFQVKTKALRLRYYFQKPKQKIQNN